MKQNFKKKAFTLVELLVVIAIIAVLASVSVVGYMHFIDKAHVSNDITLVKQLNTILSSSEVTEGKNNTLYDAILDLEESGLEEKDLKSSASDRYDLLWDQTNDRFAMFDTKKQEFTATDANNLPSLENKYLLWKMYDKLAEVEDYSIYLKKDATFEPSVLTNLSVGFDAGKNETAYDVTYVGVNTGVKFRTLNGNITINNELADVEVYGNQYLLNIQNASKNSVHVFGNAEKVNLIKGHLDIKNNAIVKNIRILTKLSSDIMLSVGDKAKEKIIKIETIDNNVKLKIENDLKIDNAKFGTFSIKNIKYSYEDSKFSIITPSNGSDGLFYTLKIDLIQLGSNLKLANVYFDNFLIENDYEFPVEISKNPILIDDNSNWIPMAVHDSREQNKLGIKAYNLKLNFKNLTEDYKYPSSINFALLKKTDGYGTGFRFYYDLYNTPGFQSGSLNYTALKVTVNAYTDNAYKNKIASL